MKPDGMEENRSNIRANVVPADRQTLFRDRGSIAMDVTECGFGKHITLGTQWFMNITWVDANKQ